MTPEPQYIRVGGASAVANAGNGTPAVFPASAIGAQPRPIPSEEAFGAVAVSGGGSTTLAGQATAPGAASAGAMMQLTKQQVIYAAGAFWGAAGVAVAGRWGVAAGLVAMAFKWYQLRDYH